MEHSASTSSKRRESNTHNSSQARSVPFGDSPMPTYKPIISFRPVTRPTTLTTKRPSSALKCWCRHGTPSIQTRIDFRMVVRKTNRLKQSVQPIRKTMETVANSQRCLLKQHFSQALKLYLSQMGCHRINRTQMESHEC